MFQYHLCGFPLVIGRIEAFCAKTDPANQVVATDDDGNDDWRQSWRACPRAVQELEDVKK